MKKPVLKYDSRGPEGNVFWILGHVQRVMQRDGRSRRMGGTVGASAERGQLQRCAAADW